MMFEGHEVNTGRQAFLDIAKSLSILFMVLVHVLLYVAVPEDAVGEAWGARFCYWLIDAGAADGQVRGVRPHRDPENMIQYGQLQNAFKTKGTGIWLR